MTDFLLILLILFLLFCLFVVLVERKFLAYAQRRFGPAIAGRNGWLQIILDLLKLMTKELFIIPNNLSSLVPLLISIFFLTQLLFIQGFIFGPSLFYFFNLDGLIFYHLILTMTSNFVLIIIGITTQSKYSVLGTFRAFIHIISMDIFITVVYVILVFSSASGNFHDYVKVQQSIPFILLLLPLAFIFVIILLLESKRAPFDHVETESEVVAGYATEYSGIYLLVFYLIEYFHLIIASNHFIILFNNAWFAISLKNLSVILWII